ncbi:hypothetical protein LBMAG42_41850 [Deltaproteobacteria bacterium]|nr:hypothetical protein LBMAG42_41850 [Deltaproteobacteria bacterium]
MEKTHRVFVSGLLPWIEPKRLLGPGAWELESRTARAELVTHAAADLDARLHNVAIGGSALHVVCEPPLSRPAVRAARTTDARRRRDTTPGFTRPGVRLDGEGKVSLTPEALALELGQGFAGRAVIDAGCGAGGNSIGFARAGCPVVAIERNAARLDDARHNARIYGVDGRITYLAGDAVALAAARATPETLLFLDPPWGVEWARSGMGVSEFPLLEEVIQAGLPAKFWRTIVKLPPSFRVNEIEGARARAVYGAAAGDARRVKFLLLTL